jgi:hypothetical protein
MANEEKKRGIQFRNLVERENDEVQELENTQGAYTRTKTVRDLTASEQEDLDRINAILKLAPSAESEVHCDPLFVGVRSLFRSGAINGPHRVNHVDGELSFEPNEAKAPAEAKQNGPADEAHAQAPRADATHPNWNQTIRVALVLGYIELDRIDLPRLVVEKKKQIVPDVADQAYQTLTQAFYTSNGEAQACLPLAARVLRILVEEGDADGEDGRPGVVDTVEFARVMRGLVDKGIDTKYPQLHRAVNLELNRIQAVGDDVPLHEINISVPDFDRDLVRDNNCKPDNIRAMGVMISTFMLDQLKLWEVMEAVQRDFRQGTLLVRRSAPATKIYQWWKDAPNRMSDFERRETLALTLGFPGGSPDTRKNDDFDRLWTQFIVSFTTLVRQNTVDNLLRAQVPGAIGQQRLRKAARDLCVNLSLYGYGMAYYSALELNKQAESIIDMLNADEVRSNYGGADHWSQVVDEIATLQLGGARNSSRYRTLATCGGIITAWLANKVNDINSSTGSLVNLKDFMSGSPSSSPEPTRTPTDYDCWNACEMWMSDQQISATDGDVLAQKSLPSPQAASRPIQVPDFARDALDQAGVSLAVRPTNGYSNGYARF